MTAVWRPEAQETWFTPVVRFPGLAGETVDAIEWTTGKDPVSETAVRGRHQGRRRLPALHARSGEERARREPAGRLQRLEGRRDAAARGAALPLAAHGRGPLVGAEPGVLGPVSVPAPDARWLPLIHRSKEQFEQKIVGGGGFQFFRSWGYSPAKPDRLFGVEDIDIPIRTEDFGDWWERAPSLGLKVGISGQGCAIDSQDGDRILVMYSASSRRFLAGLERPGRHLSLDRRRRQLHPGAAARRHLGLGREHGEPLALHAVPLRGGPRRHARDAQVVRLPAPVPKGAPAQDGALWKSTDGGQSWAMTGETLTRGEVRRQALRHAPGGERRLLLRHLEGAVPLDRRGRLLEQARGPARRQRARDRRAWADGRGLGGGRRRRALPLDRSRRELDGAKDRLRHADLRHLAARPQPDPDRRGERAPSA